MRDAIKPNDVVRHKPTGETWTVCGVNAENGALIPKGYPFPTRAAIADCELVERRYEMEPQTAETIKTLQREGLESYIDPLSAMLRKGAKV